MTVDYPLRTLLYLSGIQREPILKALVSRPDLPVLDLEGVEWSKKAEARALAEAMVKEGALSKVRIAVRIDDLDSLEVTLDLKAMVRPGVWGVVIPRVELPGEIREMEAIVRDLERHAGLEAGTLRFLPALESPQALDRAGEIAAASGRVAALLLGERVASPEGRGRLVRAAASAGVAAVDAPFDKRDRQGLVEAARGAREMGYAGKVAIRPAQVATIRRVFGEPWQNRIDRMNRMGKRY